MMMFRKYVNALEKIRKKRGTPLRKIDPVQLDQDIQCLKIEIAEFEEAEGITEEDRLNDPLTQEIIRLEAEIEELRAG